MTVPCLQIVSAGAALMSAVFWGWSAMANVPAFMTYEGLGNLPKLLRKVSKLNMIAAVFAAVSALAAGLGTLLVP